MKEQIKITIESSVVKPSPFTKGNHTEYKLKLSYKGNEYNFTFHDSVYNYQNNKKLNKDDALNSVLLDANAYEQSRDEKEFLDAFFCNVSDLYEDYMRGMELHEMYDYYAKKDVDELKAGLKAYKECEKTYNALQNMFNSDELTELTEEFADY